MADGGLRGLGCSCNENDLSNEALLCFPYHQLPEFPLTSYEVGTPRPIFSDKDWGSEVPRDLLLSSCGRAGSRRSGRAQHSSRPHLQGTRPGPSDRGAGSTGGVIECARRGDDARSGRDGGRTAQDFTTLLRMAHELDLNDCLFLEFPP